MNSKYENRELQSLSKAGFDYSASTRKETKVKKALIIAVGLLVFVADFVVAFLLWTKGLAFTYWLMPAILILADFIFVVSCFFAGFRFRYSIVAVIIYCVISFVALLLSIYVVTASDYGILMTDIGVAAAIISHVAFYVLLGASVYGSVKKAAGKGGKTVNIIVCVIAVAVFGLYTYYNFWGEYFGQTYGNGAAKVIVYSYSPSDDSYVAEGCVGNGLEIVIPEKFNGKNVSTINGALFAEEGLEKFIIQGKTAKKIKNYSGIKLSSASTDMTIEVNVDAFDDYRTDFIKNRRLLGPNSAAFSFVRKFIPVDVPDNKAVVCFDYDENTFSDEIADRYVSSYKTDKGATVFWNDLGGFFSRTDITDVSDLIYNSRNNDGFILKTAAGGNGENYINNETAVFNDSVTDVKLTFGKIFRMYLSGDNDTMYDYGKNISGTYADETYYEGKFLLAENLDDALQSLPKRTGMDVTYDVELQTGSNTEILPDGASLTASVESLGAASGEAILKVYTNWKVKAPENLSVNIDLDKIVYGDDFNISAAAETQGIALRYLVKKDGKTIFGVNSEGSFYCENFLPAQSGVYTVEAYCADGNVTSLSSDSISKEVYVDIEKKPLDFNWNVDLRDGNYDGVAHSVSATYNKSDLLSGDTVSYALTVKDKNGLPVGDRGVIDAGNYTAKVSLTTGSDKYTVSKTSEEKTFALDKREVTVERISAPTLNKTYDGKTDTAGTGYGFNKDTDYRIIGGVGTEINDVAFSSRYNSKNAAEANKITLYFGVITGGTGYKSSNYRLLTEKIEFDATITPSVIDIDYAEPTISKVYDGTNAAYYGFKVGRDYTINGIVGTEISDINSTAVYNSENVVGADKITVTFGAVVTGNGYVASNYVYTENAISHDYAATITPRQVQIKSLYNPNRNLIKDYDGSAAVNYEFTDEDYEIRNALNSEIIGVNYVAAYNSVNAGENTVTVSFGTLITTDKYIESNYSYEGIEIPYAAGINKKGIIITKIDENAPTLTKTYDGTTEVFDSTGKVFTFINGTHYNIDGIVNNEFTDVTFTAAYTSKNVAENRKVVMSNFVIPQNVSANYELKTEKLEFDAKISKSIISVEKIQNKIEKVYDGTTAAGYDFVKDTDYIIHGIVGSEIKDINLSAVYNSSDVAEANKITVTFGTIVQGSGYWITNYSYEKNTIILDYDASIKKRPITLSHPVLSSIDKTYDAFDTVNHFFINGRDYDIDNALVGEIESIDCTAKYLSADVTEGNKIEVTFGDLIMAEGKSDSNYDYAKGTVLAYDGIINPSKITIEKTYFDVIEKVYDGTTETDVLFTREDKKHYSINGIVMEQIWEITYENLGYNSANVTEANKITLKFNRDGIGTWTGHYKSSNYDFTETEWTLTYDAKITPKEITVSKVDGDNPVINKTYDGTANCDYNFSIGNNYSLSGIVNGEVTEINYTAKYNSKNVSEANKVTLTFGDFIGTNEFINTNYYISSNELVYDEASISAKAVTVNGITASVATKDYDGTKTCDNLERGTHYEVFGIVNDEYSVISYTASYADKNAADSVTVTANFVINSDNYVFPSGGGTLTFNGKISKKALTLTNIKTDKITKEYDNSIATDYDFKDGRDYTVSGTAAGETALLKVVSAGYNSEDIGDREIYVGFTMAGNGSFDPSNYYLANNTLVYKAEITAKSTNPPVDNDNGNSEGTL